MTFGDRWQSCLVAGGADDEGAAGCFDDVVGDHGEVVDAQDALDLDEQALDETEVAAGDPPDGGDGLGVGEVADVEGQGELPPVPGEDEGELVVEQGRYWWGKPRRALASTRRMRVSRWASIWRRTGRARSGSAAAR